MGQSGLRGVVGCRKRGGDGWAPRDRSGDIGWNRSRWGGVQGEERGMVVL